MKAILYDSFEGPFRIDDVPKPEVPNDGVVIEVKASGICRSDWHGWMGTRSGHYIFPTPCPVMNVPVRFWTSARASKSGNRATASPPRSAAAVASVPNARRDSPMFAIMTTSLDSRLGVRSPNTWPFVMRIIISPAFLMTWIMFPPQASAAASQPPSGVWLIRDA